MSSERIEMARDVLAEHGLLDAYDDLAARRQQDIREAVGRELLYWRGLDEDAICSRCQGAGVKAYPSTATWRGGIGGAMITTDVCNKCWGSGDESNPWPSHRKATDLATIRREGDEQGFTRGVAYVVALMQRFHVDADDVIRESGLKLRDFEQAEVDEHDLKMLRPILPNPQESKEDSDG